MTFKMVFGVGKWRIDGVWESFWPLQFEDKMDLESRITPMNFNQN